MNLRSKMHHVAIMNPKLKFIDKILAGEKTIETRWYKHRIAPWNTIAKGDEIYFKNSGESITAKATVAKVIQIDNLIPETVKSLIEEHFEGIGLTQQIKDQFVKKHLDKNYAILMWIENPKKVKPMTINKAGFGNAAAWLTTPKIENLLRIEK